jgi:hypothetical protein
LEWRLIATRYENFHEIALQIQISRKDLELAIDEEIQLPTPEPAPGFPKSAVSGLL